MCTFMCKVPSGVNASLRFDLYLHDPQSSSPGKTIPVQQITVAGEDDMGVSMCLGPLYNNVPQFADWLHVWGQMGVQRVYAYPALYRPEEWEALQVGLPFVRPRPFAHHLVQWELYKPVAGAQYHSQVLLYNDCLYRNRRRAGFLVFMDSDEVIDFPGTQNPTRNLLSWLQATVPARSAGVCLKVRFPYTCLSEGAPQSVRECKKKPWLTPRFDLCGHGRKQVLACSLVCWAQKIAVLP